MEDLSVLYEEKINQANVLLDKLQNLKHVKGISKLKKLIVSEKTFLQKATSSKDTNCKHLSTTNLTHFDALVSTMLGVENCVSILEPFSFKKNGISKRIVVDIVKDQGREWVKVTARNPKSLLMSCIGDTSYGSRTILEQAQDFVECACQNQIFYSNPRVIFKFSAGVDSALASKINKIGIQVLGEIFPTPIGFDYSSSEESENEFCNKQEEHCAVLGQDQNISSPQKELITKLNLDTTALIAYVSDMTNGSTCVNFLQEPLTLQARAEQSTKVKESLDNLFDGKELYACETAMSRFKEIVNTVGGLKEKARAKLLVEKITVVPDSISERVKKLKLGGQIKERPLIVFGTGDSMHALTVSANWGFCRSAKHQGIQLATFLHEPRALSEEASTVFVTDKEEK